jgi:hypothetical protein
METHTSGAKARRWLRFYGTAEAVPFVHTHTTVLPKDSRLIRDVSRVLGKVIAQSTSVFIAGQSVFPNSVSSYSTFGGN